MGGAALRVQRENAFISQELLASVAQVQYWRLSRFERGKSPLTPEEVFRLCTALRDIPTMRYWELVELLNAAQGRWTRPAKVNKNPL